jgi:hypothetical protein
MVIEMAFRAKLQSNEHEERRFFDRLRATIHARLGHSKADMELVKTKDISRGGCQIYGWSKIRTGQSINITIESLETKTAKVVWVVGLMAGCVFRTPLSDDDVTAVTSSHLPAEPQRPVFGRKAGTRLR